MKKLAEAADSLLEKGKITKEECELIKQAIGDDAILRGLDDIKKMLSTHGKSKTTKSLGLFGGKVGKAATAVGGTLLAGTLLQQLLKPVVQHVQAEQAFGKLTAKNPQLKEKDPEQVRDYFNVIKTFSPKAASNPIVAGALVNKMIEFGGVDHKLVQDISNIQSGVEQVDAIGSITGAAAKSLMQTPTITTES